MNTTQQSIEKKYQEILRDVEQDILFSVLQSPYQKIITKTHRENILYYIAASFIMEETGKLKCNISKDGMHISVEGVDDIFKEALSYLENMDDEMKRITINNTSTFPHLVGEIRKVCKKVEKNEVQKKPHVDGDYVDEIDLDAEEYSQNIKNAIQHGAGRGSTVKRINKYLETYPYHWVFYEFLHFLTDDISVLEIGFLQFQTKMYREFKGKMPKRIFWGYTNNRPLLTFLKTYAMALWIEKKKEKAAEILEMLLKLNTNDNQGNRFDLLAIKEGWTLDKFMKKFDKGGYFDMDIDNWYEKNYKKHDGLKKPE